MITIFNRKEVRVTRRMNEHFEICSLLESNGIPTITRTNSMTNLGRSRGIPRIDGDYAYEYRIYVHRKNYEAATNMLMKIQKK
jgi:hypothetical protein